MAMLALSLLSSPSPWTHPERAFRAWIMRSSFSVEGNPSKCCESEDRIQRGKKCRIRGTTSKYSGYYIFKYTTSWPDSPSRGRSSPTGSSRLWPWRRTRTGCRWGRSGRGGVRWPAVGSKELKGCSPHFASHSSSATQYRRPLTSSYAATRRPTPYGRRTYVCVVLWCLSARSSQSLLLGISEPYTYLWLRHSFLIHLAMDLRRGIGGIRNTRAELSAPLVR